MTSHDSSQEDKLRQGCTMSFPILEKHIVVFLMHLPFPSVAYVHLNAAGARRKTAERSVKLLSVCSRSMRNSLQIGSKVQNTQLTLRTQQAKFSMTVELKAANQRLSLTTLRNPTLHICSLVFIRLGGCEPFCAQP